MASAKFGVTGKVDVFTHLLKTFVRYDIHEPTEIFGNFAEMVCLGEPLIFFNKFIFLRTSAELTIQTRIYGFRVNQGENQFQQFSVSFVDFHNLFFFFFFFFTWVFFHEHSRFTGQQGKWEAISLSPLYHFHPLHRHLYISRTITAESSPLHIASSRTQTRNPWFPSAIIKFLVLIVF